MSRNQKSLLWKITGPHLSGESYLFGTMHLNDKCAFSFFDLALQHLKVCAVFASEYDTQNTDSVQISETFRLPGGQDLSDFLKPGMLKNLNFVCKKRLNLSIEALMDKHPMLISSFITMSYFEKNHPLSLDEALLQAALTMGLPVTGVETFHEQLAVVAHTPLEQHFKNLVWTLRHYERQKRMARKMADRYAQSDIVKLYKAAKRDSKGLRKVLLYNRNKVMVQRISELAAEAPTFCAIGAGHLAGSKGVLRGLKKMGCRVEPVF